MLYLHSNSTYLDYLIKRSNLVPYFLVMKQLISLILILGSLFSCVKEKDYPVVFQYDYSVKSTIVVPEYIAVESDTGLYIRGTHADGVIQILIPKIGGNPIIVGEYSTAAKNDFYISHTSSLGVTTKAISATLDLTHVNSYLNFTFDAVLSNGITLDEGIAQNLPFVTEAYYNTIDTSTGPDIPGSNIDTLTNGIFAEIPNVYNPFYEPVTGIITLPTDSNITYRAVNGNISVEIELMKPINALVGNTYDLAQANQSLVKMRWKDLSVPGPTNNLEIQEGSFYLFSANNTTSELEFGFSGHLFNLNKTATNPIQVGYGRKLPFY